MSLEFTAGDTSQSIDVTIADDAGLPVIGLVAATFPEVVASRAGAYADVTLPLSDLALITTPWFSGGLKERGSGAYRLDLPDSLLADIGTQKLRGEATNKRLIAESLTIKATDAGSGARSVTITVNDGATALQNAKVRVSQGAEAYILPTNASGVVAFALDDATWTVRITKPGYVFTTTTILVNGTETATYSMTLLVISASVADRVTGYLSCDTSGVTVSVQQIGVVDSGEAYSGAIKTAVSNGVSLVQITGLVPGAKHQIWASNGRPKHEFKIPAGATLTYELPDVLFG